MSIKGVLKNLRNHGVSGTYRTYKLRKLLRLAEGYIEESRCRTITDPEQYREYMDEIWDLEKCLKQEAPKLYRTYFQKLKSYYVTELFPTVYQRKCSKPVEKKAIFMENGNSPSPSNRVMIKKMQKQGEYEIHVTGLHIRQVSEKEYFENALKFIEDTATAKAIFLSTANDLLSHIDLRDETKLIQLWHGCGMFKKVGYSTIDKKFGKGEEERKKYFSYKNYSYVTIAAEAQAWTFENAMHIDRDIIVPVGISRTDIFYDKAYIKSLQEKLYKAIPMARGKKIILYAPTFRGPVANGKAPDQLDIVACGEALADKYILLIKHHGLAKNIPEIPAGWKNTFAYDLNANPILGIDGLLAVSDICITDYSSIGFEFSLMERPLIFFAYDLDEYLDERGMYFDYNDITPGPIFTNNQDMISYIKNIDKRFNKQEVIDFKNKYMSACDGHATERTIALIEQQKS